MRIFNVGRRGYMDCTTRSFRSARKLTVIALLAPAFFPPTLIAPCTLDSVARTTTVDSLSTDWILKKLRLIDASLSRDQRSSSVSSNL